MTKVELEENASMIFTLALLVMLFCIGVWYGYEITTQAQLLIGILWFWGFIDTRFTMNRWEWWAAIFEFGFFSIVGSAVGNVLYAVVHYTFDFGAVHKCFIFLAGIFIPNLLGAIRR